jgi:hypothetical protein
MRISRASKGEVHLERDGQPGMFPDGLRTSLIGIDDVFIDDDCCILMMFEGRDGGLAAIGDLALQLEQLVQNCGAIIRAFHSGHDQYFHNCLLSSAQGGRFNEAGRSCVQWFGVSPPGSQ